MRSLLGQTLGHYQINTRLGSGGAGEVYRATDLRLMRDVALKVLRSDAYGDAGEFVRLQKEARVASSLNHPNIVTIHDVGTKDSTPYIAMELVQGTTLREVLAGGLLQVDRLLRIGEQIAYGLAKAHEAGIVHRDLKPENLMLTEDGLVKILDFGLAGSFDRNNNTIDECTTRKTPSPSFVGTVAYMSPEQVRGRTVEYRSDQFTLGIILYEMATGLRPFQRATVFQTFTAIAEEQHESLCKLNVRVPLRLAVLIDKCLSKNPDDRYSSTRELAQQLGTIRDEVAGTIRQSQKPVVAVLPFADISADHSCGYFCEGIAEEIRTHLQSVTEVALLSRLAVSHEAARSIRHIVAESGANNLLEGSVRLGLNRVRIAAILIDAATGHSLWSKQYDRKLRNTLAIQTDVAKRVVTAVLPILCRPRDSRAGQKPG